ncbi:MAG: asparagine synthase (glutamine-hydrolyzing) [Gemmatimonadetes bacterium]|nr:asparagine synthase (glutamine-hydrolyzing) [Gemmatimonadota bacterium]
MCGICGKRDPRGVAKDALRRMTDSLAHRGPDDEGVFVDGPVGLGHRRLSIIDLAGGRQPMRGADGSLCITFNGEIYNYRELRAELEARGRRFKTRSDTEVILALYEQSGPACVESLRGMFAFAIHDAKADRLFLARDHLGQKPLYYTDNGERFAFASEIKALLADDPSLREMDEKALHQYLTLRIIPSPRTMFRRIHKLPPGHCLVHENGSVTISRYWGLSYEPKDVRREDELLDELDERAQDAVRHCMVSDVPVGAFLSGGLDSGLVVGMMAKQFGTPVSGSEAPPGPTAGAFPTFSAGIPYADYDENPVAALVSRRYGTSGTFEKLDASIVRMLPEIVWHLDEPADPLSLCNYFISGIARGEVKVALTGDGGDELFAGYDRYSGYRYVDYYSILPLFVREHLVRRLIDFIPDRFSQKSLSQKLRWVNRLSLVDSDCRYARSLGHFFFTEEFRDELYGSRLESAVAGFDPEEALAHYFGAEDERDVIDRMLNADTMIRLPDHSLMILDRMSMAHGLEARAPFLDHELAQFAATLPVRFKVNGSRLRHLQRRLGERYLPNEVFAGGKRGFSSGISYLLNTEYGRLFSAFLRDSHLVREGYLQFATVKRIFDEHLDHEVDHHNRLWLLCHAEIWYRMMIEGATVESIRAAR